MSSFMVAETIHTLQCADCTMTFGVPRRFEEDRRKDHKTFFCPNGHTNVFSGESENEKMRRERDIARQQVARAEEDAARARRAAINAQKETKRLKKRAAAGTCPCCQRTVLQMARHMKTKHPEFVAAEVSNVVAMKAKK
jgi:hypothetical protein